MRENEKKRALRAARGLALEAGKFLRERQHGKRVVEFKGGMGNLVTEIDRASERKIVRGLRRLFPSHDIRAEEKERRETGSPFCWHVDPLDGTTNYVHGLPFFAVSIGLEVEGRRTIGVVYQPSTGDLFEAVRGGGAFRNRKRIHVSTTPELRRSLLVTGFSYQAAAKRRNLAFFQKLVFQARAIRRLGSAALDLCYTASGMFDGFWEFPLGSWDIAAGMLMVEEAGGRTSDFQGEEADLTRGEILATNGRIHGAMLKVLRNRAGRKR